MVRVPNRATPVAMIFTEGLFTGLTLVISCASTNERDQSVKRGAAFSRHAATGDRYCSQCNGHTSSMGADWANTVGARCLMLTGEPRADRATDGIIPLPPNHSWPVHFSPAKVALLLA
jgi:hypothetical protein